MLVFATETLAVGVNMPARSVPSNPNPNPHPHPTPTPTPNPNPNPNPHPHPTQVTPERGCDHAAKATAWAPSGDCGTLLALPYFFSFQVTHRAY